MPAVHRASLVPASQHSPALLKLLKQKINRGVINCFVDRVFELFESEVYSRPFSRTICVSLVSDLIEFTETRMPIILVALTYLNRAKLDLHLPSELFHESVCLGALILAHKYANETYISSIQWSIITCGMFNTRRINHIEKAFINALKWNLQLSEADVLVHCPVFAEIYPNMRKFGLSLSISPTTSDVTASSSSSEVPMTPATSPNSNVMGDVRVFSPRSCSYGPMLDGDELDELRPEHICGDNLDNSSSLIFSPALSPDVVPLSCVSTHSLSSAPPSFRIKEVKSSSKSIFGSFFGFLLGKNVPNSPFARRAVLRVDELDFLQQTRHP